MLVLIILTSTFQIFFYFYMIRKLGLQEKVVTKAERSYLNTMKKNQQEENFTNI